MASGFSHSRTPPGVASGFSRKFTLKANREPEAGAPEHQVFVRMTRNTRQVLKCLESAKVTSDADRLGEIAVDAEAQVVRDRVLRERRDRVCDVQRGMRPNQPHAGEKIR